MYGVAMAKAERLSFLEEPSPLTRWFSSRNSVVRRGATSDVFVGGTLIGTFEDGEQLERNAMLVQLAEDPKCHLGRLADAFEVSSERLRQLRREYEAGGLEALRPGEGGGRRRLSQRDVARLERLFERGLRAPAAHAKLKVGSLSTVSRALRGWKERREAATVAAVPRASAEERTLALPGVDMLPAPTAPALSSVAAVDDVRGGGFVQHVGTWLMSAMLERLGLYRVAEKVAIGRAPADVVRVALDATVATFALGEHTLEGVRRLRTPTAMLLLRSVTVPSPDALRELMDDLSADLGAVEMHFSMLRRYLDADRQLALGEPGVFYVDNHMRPYTGKHVVRRGWRMQDKRVRPGVSDYYVHDEDGRPLFRIDVPSHDSLPLWMMPLVGQLRAVVGQEDRVLVAFDRGGAFPETMAALRDEGAEFVTYERAPFPRLAVSAFTSSLTFGDDDTVRFVEARVNLKKGRGRVRRIALLGDDDRQINLLASSTLPAERLIEVMRGRWRQENAFKHGKERWGINHLDARKVTPVDPDEIMPNPARRRLDVARRAANVREGDGRCILARYDEAHPRHQKAVREIEAALESERLIDALRPTVPKHARVGDTELAGQLVRHDGRRKLLLDTVRIACANAESDLAQLLAASMRRPREAKHLVANLLRSPGRVRIGSTTIAVELAPAATRAEGQAITTFLHDVSDLHLTLPGDPNRRTLRFRSQLQ